jgi:hypothetical protein
LGLPIPFRRSTAQADPRQVSCAGPQRRPHPGQGGLSRSCCAEKQASKAAAKTPECLDIVERVAEQYLKRHVSTLRPLTQREAKRYVQQIISAWHGRRLSTISKAEIHALLDKIIDDGAPVAANRCLSWLSGLCNWAIGRGLLDVNPCAGVKPPTIEASRDRVLDDGTGGSPEGG